MGADPAESRQAVPAEEEPAVNLIRPDGSRQLVVLAHGTTSFGRHSGNTVVIDDPTVSSTQLTLTRIGAQIKICDESSYGTRLQGARLLRDKPIRVHHGQTISFGGDDQALYQLVVRDSSERPPTHPPKSPVDRVRLPAPLRRTADALVHQYVERTTAVPRPANVQEIADRLEVHTATVRRNLNDLEEILKTDPALRGSERLHALAERILVSDAHRS